MPTTPRRITLVSVPLILVALVYVRDGSYSQN
jgi:hypothetical protein